MIRKVEKFEGFTIQHEEGGYWWANGPEVHGYFETVEQARRDISDWNRGL